MVKRGGRLALRLYSFPMPVVAACTGHGIAMGSFLLLASDIRIGAAGAFKIGANESAINMVLPVFGLELPKARLSPRYLTRALVNATLFDPEEAVAVGFLDQVVAADQVRGTAIEQARMLSSLTSSAYARNKILLRQATIDVIQPSVEAHRE